MTGRFGGAPLAAFAGGLFGIWIYGLRAIDPGSFAWMLQGDSAQHYLGSVYFLNEPWHWPPGLITRFGDVPTSVVFTDAIPLVALLAKLVGVPASLQYYGLWMVACHALAGWFGHRLLHRMGVAGFPALMGAFLFAMSPALLLRAYGHEALMGHFLVLAALERALGAWRWRGWLVLAATAVLVHPYLAAMVGLIGLGAAAAALADGAVTRTRLAAQAVASLAILWCVAWAAGYFVGSGQLSAGGFGIFSSNLLTWIDPMDWAAFNRRYDTGTPYSSEWSRFLPAQLQATGGQYEGFAYLGAGMLALVALATGAWAVARRSPGPSENAAASSLIPALRWKYAVWACVVLALLAISTRPSIGSHVVAEIHPGRIVERALGVFRASGRFIWPLTYLLMAWAIARVGRLPRGAWLVALGLAVQIADLNGKFKEFRGRFRHGPPQLAQPVGSPLWASVLARCPNLAMVSGVHPGAGWVGPALAAGVAGARFYPAPTARYSPEAEAQRLAAVRKLIAANAWQADTVYLLAAPMPEGVTVKAIAEGLPPGMSHERADGLDLVFAERCRRG
ncbi:MAG: DUF6311 domain-containing protein [Ramlibacter sp.]|nr:DUF6311 domain-containing protein [Ramlibacter sp.]